MKCLGTLGENVLAIRRFGILVLGMTQNIEISFPASAFHALSNLVLVFVCFVSLFVLFSYQLPAHTQTQKQTYSWNLWSVFGLLSPFFIKKMYVI